MRAGTKYDVVMLDAFDHEYIPEHLLTREFLTEVKSLLSPQGVLVANTFSSSRLYDHESTTYADVFGTFYNLKRDNRVIIARPAGLARCRRHPRTSALEYEKVLRSFRRRRAVDAADVLDARRTGTPARACSRTSTRRPTCSTASAARPPAVAVLQRQRAGMQAAIAGQHAWSCPGPIDRRQGP